MTTYVYYRVSTDKQDSDNQKLGVEALIKRHNFKEIKEYTDDGVSGGIDYRKRKINKILQVIKEGDVLVCSELSRLGRKMLDIMEILKILMEKNAKLYTVKENYELGDNIQSKVLAFAFGLSAEIERTLISQRTKEALARRKAEGAILGRPKGRGNKELKLEKYYDKIKFLLEKGKSYNDISKYVKAYRTTVSKFINDNEELKNIAVNRKELAKKITLENEHKRLLNYINNHKDDFTWEQIRRLTTTRPAEIKKYLYRNHPGILSYIGKIQKDIEVEMIKNKKADEVQQKMDKLQEQIKYLQTKKEGILNGN